MSRERTNRLWLHLFWNPCQKDPCLRSAIDMHRFLIGSHTNITPLPCASIVADRRSHRNDGQTSKRNDVTPGVERITNSFP